ncbi:VOC family protein [Saccharopolyspora sp. K220]|uniref:VOC family protein n=1 Tax=Saccharopolyspora soli TaxID=2926618 RepID=UPI001F584CD0|nr:VOC family protein [Saccharopolyspora soli]MCI2420849.1 VOC family protein [Saccharopolyspora soli]
MTLPPVWFDITAEDAAQAREFYAALFGWEIDIDESMDYGLTRTADGMPGGIGQAGPHSPHPPGVVLYFAVDDVAAAVDRAERLGGSCVVPIWEIPGLGEMAVVVDVDGNRIGLWQR